MCIIMPLYRLGLFGEREMQIDTSLHTHSIRSTARIDIEH